MCAPKQDEISRLFNTFLDLIEEPFSPFDFRPV